MKTASIVPAFAFALAAGQASAATSVSEVDIPAGAGKAVKAQVFRFDSADYRLSVVPLAMYFNDAQGAARVGVRDLAMTSYAVTSRNERVVYVNGGFSGARSDQPMGLLVAGGRVISLPSYAVVPADEKNACPFLQKERFRFSGLVCARRGGQLTTGLFSERAIAGCEEAIQAGPALHDENGKPAICSAEADRPQYRRTVVCTRPTGQKREVVVIMTLAPMSLYHLANWIAGDGRKEDAVCEGPVNLSGDSSSGVAIVDAKAGHKPRVKMFGDGTYPQASVMAFTGVSQDRIVMGSSVTHVELEERPKPQSDRLPQALQHLKAQR